MFGAPIHRLFQNFGFVGIIALAVPPGVVAVVTILRADILWRVALGVLCARLGAQAILDGSGGCETRRHGGSSQNGLTLPANMASEPAGWVSIKHTCRLLWSAQIRTFPRADCSTVLQRLASECVWM